MDSSALTLEDIVNGALRLLGKQAVSSTNQTPLAAALAANVPELARLVFASRNWRFSTKAVQLQRKLDDNGEALVSRYRSDWTIYSFPTGALRIRNVFREFYRNEAPISSEVDDDGIHTLFYDQIYAAAVYEVPMDHWPIEFGRYMQAYAALEAAPLNLPESVPMLQREMEARRKLAETSDTRDGGKRRRVLNPDGYISARTGAFGNQRGRYLFQGPDCSSGLIMGYNSAHARSHHLQGHLAVLPELPRPDLELAPAEARPLPGGP